MGIFNQWIQYRPQDQCSSTMKGSEFNSKDFYKRLEQKNIKLFSINKSDFHKFYF